MNTSITVNEVPFEVPTNVYKKMNTPITVNGVPFEVPEYVYKKYFIVAEVENAYIFQGVNDFTIEATLNKDEIKRCVSALIDRLIMMEYPKIDPFTGMDAHAIVKYESMETPTTNILNPDILIEFADKYLVDSKKIVTEVVAFCNSFDFSFRQLYKDEKITVSRLCSLTGPIKRTELASRGFIQNEFNHIYKRMEPTHTARSQIRLNMYSLAKFMIKTYGHILHSDNLINKYFAYCFDEDYLSSVELEIPVNMTEVDKAVLDIEKKMTKK